MWQDSVVIRTNVLTSGWYKKSAASAYSVLHLLNVWTISKYFGTIKQQYIMSNTALMIFTGERDHNETNGPLFHASSLIQPL